MDDETLSSLLAKLEASAPEDRIDYRNAVLAFGLACIHPLADLAERVPDLATSIAAWFEVLVQRDPDTKPEVLRALTAMAHGRDSSIASAVLGRLGGAPRSSAAKPARKPAQPRRNVEAEVHARIIRAARDGRILTYADLETNRRYVGQYLFNISRAEADQGHPPLTALVVHKTNGLPGDGFLPAMEEIGFAHRGERMEPVWKRAVAEVHAFWSNRPNDEVGADLSRSEADPS